MIERLWNGWRAAYVTSGGAAGGVSADDVTSGRGSVFTRILQSGLPDVETHIVHRGPTCFAILNAFPYSVGHVLVIPYREVADLEALEPAEVTELWATVTDAVVAIKRAYAPEGLNIGVNLGRPAGGSVSEHLHVHAVPRWTGDGNFMTATANTRTLPEALPDSAAKLRVTWPAAPGEDGGRDHAR
ncbi:MAG: HIT domain-containing protein [Ilumatobacteraceae bacterium]